MINVAPGAINATSTDAINGSQLYMASDALNKKTDVLGSTVATTIGGGTTYNPITGTVEGSIDVGGNTYTTVQEALDATGHNITTSSVGTGVVNNTSVSKIGSGDTVTYTAGNNIVITQSDKEVQIATSMTPVFTSVTSDTLTVNDSTTLNGGTTVNNSFTVGAGTTVNMGGNVITNVAAGVDMTDAVNVSQLVSSLAAVKTEVVAGTNIAGVVKSTGVDGHDIYTVNAQGTSTSAGSSAVTVVGTPGANNVTDYAVDLSAATKASLVNADSAVQTVVTQINGTTVKTIDKTNNTANFVTGDNIVLTDDGAGGIKIGTSLTPTFTSVTSDTLTVNDGLTVGAGATINMGGNVITNVAAGTNPTDAVNVSQLTEVEAIANKGWDLSTNGGSVSNIAPGGTVDMSSSDGNITISNVGGNIDFKLADDVAINNSLTIGGTTTIDGNGLTIAGGPSVTTSGIDAGGNVITNVAAGVNQTDAVNVSQLTSSVASAKTEVAAGTNIVDVVKTTGDKGQDIYTVNAKGTTASAGSSALTVVSAAGASNVTDYVVDLSDATKASLVNADSAVQTVVTQINGTTVKTIDKTNNTANFVTGDNIVLTDDGAGGIKIGTSLTPTFTSVTSDTLTVNNTTVLNGGTTVNNSFTVGEGTTVNMGGNVITNVGAGVNSTDAVNVSQLTAAQAGDVKYDTNADGSKNYNNVTLQGNGGTQIHNVADGTRPMDAVNLRQLDKMGDKVSGGVAASAAMAVVTPVEPGRYHLSGAAAYYNGQYGLGLNLLKRSYNGQTTVHAGVGWGSGGGGPIVRVGAGFSFGGN